MANTLIKLTVQNIEGQDIPQGTSPNNFQVQLFSKSRVDAVSEIPTGTELFYAQYQATNKLVKIRVSEAYNDIRSALETNSDGNEKFEVTVLEVNGNPISQKQILNVNKLIKVVKNTTNPAYSDIFYEANLGLDPKIITVAENLDTLLVLTRDGYYSGGLAAELL
jgi:hypothetical protein